MANLVMPGTALPWWSEAVRRWLLWGGATVAIIIALGAVAHDAIERLLERATRALLTPSPTVFSIAVAAATIALALYFGWRLFGFHPSTGDEFSQLFQARLLAGGHLSARSESPSEFFSTLEMLDAHGQWFSQFPIGGPALLTIGVWLHAPFVVNPILAGIAAVAVYRFVAATTDELLARVSAALFCLSPFVLFMAGSEMNHVGTLTFLWTAVAAIPCWLKPDQGARAAGVRAAGVIGAALGLAATIRPYDAALVGVVVVIFQLRAASRDASLAKSLIVEVIAGAIPVALLLATNWATIGDPFTFGYDALNGPGHRPGFHITPMGYEHTPTRGIYLISAYLMKLDLGLFGWPVPALLLVAAALVLQRRATSWDILMNGILLLVLAGYAAYWFEGYFVGPRFLYTIIPIAIVYTARFPILARERLRVPALRAAVALLLPICILAAWAMPASIEKFFGVQAQADTYHRASVGAAIARAVEASGARNALVFIPDGWHARLAARIRGLGLRPLEAERAATSLDACTLQQALDEGNVSAPNDPVRRRDMLAAAIARDPAARSVAGLSTLDALAFVPGRPLRPECEAELAAGFSNGASLAELLPYERIAGSGELGGPAVYARDFGPRDERLRPRFGDREWLVARVTGSGDHVSVSLQPYR